MDQNIAKIRNIYWYLILLYSKDNTHAVIGQLAGGILPYGPPKVSPIFSHTTTNTTIVTSQTKYIFTEKDMSNEEIPVNVDMGVRMCFYVFVIS